MDEKTKNIQKKELNEKTIKKVRTYLRIIKIAIALLFLYFFISYYFKS